MRAASMLSWQDPARQRCCLLQLSSLLAPGANRLPPALMLGYVTGAGQMVRCCRANTGHAHQGPHALCKHAAGLDRLHTAEKQPIAPQRWAASAQHCALCTLHTLMHGSVECGLAAAVHAGEAHADSTEAGPETASKLWALLAALLLPDAAARGSAVNPALVSTAAQTCQWVANDATSAHPADAAALGALGAALLDALQLLARRDPLQFSPSLEHRCGVATWLEVYPVKPPSHSASGSEDILHNGNIAKDLLSKTVGCWHAAWRWQKQQWGPPVPLGGRAGARPGSQMGPGLSWPATRWACCAPWLQPTRTSARCTPQWWAASWCPCCAAALLRQVCILTGRTGFLQVLAVVSHENR